MALKTEVVEETKINTEEMNNNIIPLQETGIVDVEAAVESWNAYQELCRKLLTDDDFQKYKGKDENGKTITKKFHKKSAWFKLGRAFNVKTSILEKSVERGKNGQVKEAYYRVEAKLPNDQRIVEADASCDIWEKGKAKASGHDLRTTAETRATNRAIAKLIGAGEVSSEEINNTDMKKIK